MIVGCSLCAHEADRNFFEHQEEEVPVPPAMGPPSGSARVSEEMGCAYRNTQASRRMRETLFNSSPSNFFLNKQRRKQFLLPCLPSGPATERTIAPLLNWQRRTTRGSPCCVGGTSLPASKRELAGMTISCWNEARCRSVGEADTA